MHKQGNLSTPILTLILFTSFLHEWVLTFPFNMSLERYLVTRCVTKVINPLKLDHTLVNHIPTLQRKDICVLLPFLLVRRTNTFWRLPKTLSHTTFVWWKRFKGLDWVTSVIMNSHWTNKLNLPMIQYSLHTFEIMNSY